MIYKSYLQFVKDINYMEELNEAIHYREMRSEMLTANRFAMKIKKIFQERIKEKYEATKKDKVALGKFLKQFPLKFKEFCCLIDLVEDNNERSDFEFRFGIRESRDIFKKYKVRYESSNLKRFGLVYRIINPLKPMKNIYEVSYKAQLALKNKKYTEEYQQLDMALEEDSKTNSPDQLDSLYYSIDPKFTFQDLVAPAKLKDSLRTALSREKSKDQIFKTWGIGKVVEYGRGTTLNFRGPPGTGKTLAAHCFAKEVGRKLLMVRYDQLQSSWVGQTEKHIQRVFKIAKTKNAVLFFDEADAIALSRKSLERSWEMSQVNTLLKELERFDGVCIFATNFAEKYDPAFERRLTMHIDFNLPDNNQALKILEKLMPMKSRDKNFSLKGMDLSGLSGGDIKNVVLNAAGIASKENSNKIKMEHVDGAIKMVKNEKKDSINSSFMYG